MIISAGSSRGLRARGFSLVELLVVMFIIALLSVPLLAMQKKVTDWMKVQAFKTRAKQLENIARAHYAQQLEDRRILNGAAIGTGGVFWADSFIPDPSSSAIGSTVSATVNIVSPNGDALGTLYAIGAQMNVGSRLQIDGNSICAPGYAACSSYYSKVNGVVDETDYLLDPWNHPMLTVVYVPAVINGSAGGDPGTYCPTRDNSSPKLLLVSAGPDGAFATPGGSGNLVGVLTSLAGGIDNPFRADGSWNASWSTNAWYSTHGASNDDLYKRVIFEDIDSRGLAATVSSLKTIETTLKNAFYTKISSHMEIPVKDPNPTLSASTCTPQAGLFLQPTRANWFYLSHDGSVVFTAADAEALRDLSGMTYTELQDAWGNPFGWDASVKGTSVHECDISSGFVASGTAPTDFVTYDVDGSTTISPPFSARAFSPCAYSSDLPVTYYINGNMLWPTTVPTVRDASLSVTIPGMF